MQTIESIKDFQMNKTLKVIMELGPISRIDISKKLGIPQPTVTRITEKLIEEGLIRENGFGFSSAGRRPVLLEFNPTCYYSIGVELGRSAIKIAVTDLRGQILSFHQQMTNNKGKISDLVAYINRTINDLLMKASISDEDVLGVGFGIPGPLTETPDGLLSLPNFYDEKEIPLKKILQQRIKYPVIFDINANAAALAEKWFGKGRGFQNILYIMADAGIGSGIIMNGDIYRGSHKEAGIVGHSTIDINGEKCSCGNYGCLETLVSVTKVITHVQRKLKLNSNDEYFKDKTSNLDVSNITLEDVFSAYAGGSTIASEALEEAGLYLGIGVANLISFFDPELVIIGGRLGNKEVDIAKTVESVINKRVLGNGGRKTPVISSDFTEGVVLGAAALVINESFSFFN
ncbi:ROK family transcriptional regulator [Bacillus marinisedimentorum]|uniref:ROK family transcriptional regulator n=1 Tax=Bacillus marinisedimentorum TaxID=1821260 RepID=UPI0007E27DD0|nr:ROK family transcriptional regulator [Bacillus marinisedimentorum]